jgi:hypothetical protein
MRGRFSWSRSSITIMKLPNTYGADRSCVRGGRCAVLHMAVALARNTMTLDAQSLCPDTTDADWHGACGKIFSRHYRVDVH